MPNGLDGAKLGALDEFRSSAREGSNRRTLSEPHEDLGRERGNTEQSFTARRCAWRPFGGLHCLDDRLGDPEQQRGACDLWGTGAHPCVRVRADVEGRQSKPAGRAGGGADRCVLDDGIVGPMAHVADRRRRL